MGSRGSVIPLFVSQIKSGKDLTITSPNMTRFIMTLNHAVDLVKYAFENGNQGDLFIQKSPAVTIKTLAEALLEIYESKSRIREIGVRHGEKMFETLVTNEEMLTTDDLGDYYRITADNRDLNYDNYFSKGESKREHKTEVNSNNANLLNIDQTKKILLTLPEIISDLK